jgi:hypothetical protein
MRRSKAPQRIWHVEGYNSTELIFDERFPTGQMTVEQVKRLLQALASRHLTDNEIVGAYATRKTHIANRLLDVHKDQQHEKRRTVFMCGDNPYYVATPEEP